jgi:hypothetical protein
MNARDLALNKNVSIIEIPYSPRYHMSGAVLEHEGKQYYTLTAELLPRKSRKEPKMLRVTVIPYGQKSVFATSSEIINQRRPSGSFAK